MSVYHRLAIVAFLGISGTSFATEPTAGTSSRPTSGPTTGSPMDDEAASGMGTTGTTGTTGTSGTTGTTAGTPATTSQQGQQASQGEHQGQMNDAEIMGLLDALNRAEMEQARYVLSKTKNLNVKRFAQMAIDEHHELAASNRAMTSDMRNEQTNQPTPGGSAGAASGGLGTTGATGVGGSIGDTGSVDPGTNTGTTAGGSNTTAGIDHEGTGTAGTMGTGAASRNTGAGSATTAGTTGSTASTGATGSTDSMSGQGAHGGMASGTGSAAAQQITDASKQQLAALKSASGAELDRMYVQNVIQTHQKALDIVDGKMTTAAQSPEVKQQLMQLRPELRQHLEEAQQLQSNLGSKSRSGGSK